MIKRIIFDLVVLGAIFYTPWWVIAPLSFIGVFLFPSYYEIFAFGLITDLLYGGSTSAFYGIVGVTSSIVIFFLALQTKSIVRPTY